jgi:hypothetical protein
MTVEPILTQLAFTQFAIARNVHGVTHEESLHRAVADASHMNWVMGHIVNGRSNMLRLLGEAPVWSDDEAAPYRRGAGLLAADRYRDFTEIVGLFKDSQDGLIAALGRATPEHWNAVAPAKLVLREGMTAGEMVAALVFHEAYQPRGELAGRLGVQDLGSPPRPRGMIGKRVRI